MFCQLFSIYFLLYLIVSDLQMHFSPFFYFPLFLIYFPFPNSQKAGVFLSFRAGFSAKDAGFFSFYAYLLTMPKFTLHFFVTLLKNSTDKISLTKRLYILPLQR